MRTGPRSLYTKARFVSVATSMGLCAATVPVTTQAGADVSSAVMLAPADEAAAMTRAAILPVVVDGDPMPDADRTQLTGRLVDGLRRGAFEVVAPEEVLAASAEAAQCRSAECYTAVARAVGASHVIRAVIKVEDRDYQVEMVMLDGDDGSQVANTEDSCQICGVVEVGDLIDTAAATLRTKLDALAQGPASLVVSSTPPGAQVTIDGELKGTTPFNAPVLAGKHVLRISYEGYITVEREVTFIEGIEDVQRFELEKVPSRLPSRPWGWVSLGLGIGGLGAAVAFNVLDDEPYRFNGACGPENRDEQNDCRRVWDTDWIVLSSAAVGAGLVTLGVAVLLNSARRRSKGAKAKKEGRATAGLERRRSLRWGLGPGRVGVQGRF